MKKFLSVATVFAILALFSSDIARAGKPFEGVITFKITYPDSKFSESQMAMFPKVLTVSIKGTKSRTDMQMTGINTVELTDYEAKTSVSLVNLMGQKYAIKKTTAEIETEMGTMGEVTVEHTTETKMIAGYTCKKVIVTANDDGVKSTFEGWYTEELGSKLSNFNNPLYKDIDGMLLEFLMVNREISMKFTATSVEKKGLSAKDFEVPTDYEITTQDELKSKFGGGTE